MADDVREAYRRGLDVREYRRMRDEGTLTTNERADLQEAYRLQIPVEELRARRAAAGRIPAGVRRAASVSDMQMADVPGNIPSGPSANTVRRARENLASSAAMQEADMPGNLPSVSQADIQRAREGIMRAEDMQNADMPGNIPAPGTSFAPNEIQEAASRARMERQRQRNRPNTRMTAATSVADLLNQQELDRIAAARGVSPVVGTQAPAERPFLDRALGRIGLRRTNETGEGAPSTGSFMADIRGLGGALGFKHGGKVKKMAKGGVVKSSASRRGDGIVSRGKTKGRMV